MKNILGINYYSVSDVCTETGLHPITVRRYITNGMLKAQLIGRSYYISEFDYFDFMQKGTSKQIKSPQHEEETTAKK